MIKIKDIAANPLKTSPEYTWAGVYGKCVLKQNQIVLNGLIMFIYLFQTLWLLLIMIACNFQRRD